MPRRSVVDELAGIARWYLENIYERLEGPNVVPFYADPSRVGYFAVDRTLLAEGHPNALFRLLVTLSAYQSRRDVDIMGIQRATTASQARAMTSPPRLQVLVEKTPCTHLREAHAFDTGCDVRRDFTRDITTCDSHPRTACHVKDATTAIRRMGDLGKLPTSAWLHVGPSGLASWVADACSLSDDPHERAALLVDRLSAIYKIGRKLATMYVTALSVPSLASPAPWFPAIDGSRLVVVDANVGRAIQIWRRQRGPKTYEAMSAWLIAVADKLDLAPRFLQQAIYTFRSRSNRSSAGDACAASPCATCPSKICPFYPR